MKSLREQFHDNDEILTSESLSEGHYDKFIKKLDKNLHQKKRGRKYFIYWMAASIVFVLGLGWLSFNGVTDDSLDKTLSIEEANILGSISPSLEKLENFYLAQINSEISKIKLTDSNKDLVNEYLKQLKVLDKQYQEFMDKLQVEGVNEFLVEAIIDNLKLRLELVQKLKKKIIINESNNVI